MQISKSERLFAEAKTLMPGGVNSPVRAFKSVGGQPRFIERGAGSRVWDVDGNSYIDYVCSWGPLIAGHAHPEVVEAIKLAAEKGTSYGAPTKLEVELAHMVVDALPSVEMVRFVNSGTEAAMSALRLARAYTGRNKIIKLTGCYHGHSDMLLVQAGSGVMTLSLPDSPGVPPSAAQDTLTAPYNDLEAVEKIFEANFNGVAALILEPVVGNVGVVLPKEGYLAGLRDICSKYGALLIFDEVITGFRVAYGGAQSLFGVMPDLTCLGKIIGGGLPVGAYGGRKEIMEMVAPMGPVYQAGTLSGNPLAMTAGIATLQLLQRPGAYEHLEAMSSRLAEGFGRAAEAAGITVQQNRVGSMQSTFFASEPVTCYETSVKSDTKRFSVFHAQMLENGVYLAPSQFESTFVSLAHTPEDIDQTVEAAKKSLRAVVTS